MVGYGGRHLQHGQRALRFRTFHQRGLRGRGHAVVKLDTLLKLGQLLGRGLAVDQRQITFLHVMTRVQKTVAQLAVGAEQQQPRGVEVQTPDGEQPREAIGGHELGHRGTALRVGHGGHVAGRFVQHDGDGSALQAHGHAVDGNLVHQRVHLASQLGNHLAVHRHAPCRHEVLRPATARRAGARQELLQAHGHKTLLGLRLIGFELPGHDSPITGRSK